MCLRDHCKNCVYISHFQDHWVKKYRKCSAHLPRAQSDVFILLLWSKTQKLLINYNTWRKQLNLIFKKLEAANVWYHRLEMTKLLIDYQHSWQQLSFSDWWLQLYLLFSAPDTSIHLLTLQTLWTHNKTVSVLLHKNFYSFYWGCIWTSWCLTVQEALCLKPTEKLSLFTYLEVEIDFFKVISTSQLLQQQVQWRSSEDSNFSFRISFLSSHNFLRHDPLLSKCHKCLQGWKCSKCASFVWFIMSKLLK